MSLMQARVTLFIYLYMNFPGNPKTLSMLRTKWHPIPYTVHYFWPEHYGSRLKAVNRVPFGMQPMIPNSEQKKTEHSALGALFLWSVQVSLSTFQNFSRTGEKGWLPWRLFYESSVKHAPAFSGLCPWQVGFGCHKAPWHGPRFLISI